MASYDLRSISPILTQRSFVGAVDQPFVSKLWSASTAATYVPSSAIDPRLTEMQARPVFAAPPPTSPVPFFAQTDPGAARRRYEDAARREQALRLEMQRLLDEAKQTPAYQRTYLQGRGEFFIETASGNPVAMRQLAARLEAAGLHQEAQIMRAAAQRIENLRARAPAPGGAALSAPSKTSFTAVTKAANGSGSSSITRYDFKATTVGKLKQWLVPDGTYIFIIREAAPYVYVWFRLSGSPRWTEEGWIRTRDIVRQAIGY